ALWRGSGPGEAQRHETMNVASTVAKQAEIWTCSMHPQFKLPKAGKCPICGMDLIPLDMGKDDMGAGLRELSVSKNAAARMEIQTAPVQRKFVAAEVRMVGKVDYDETRVSYITAWVPGRLDRLFVDYTGVPVKKGDHMVYLYSPELLGAQEELLQAVKAVKELEKSDVTVVRKTTEATVEAVREKLRLWGLTPEQIKKIEQRGKADDHMTIYSPVGGIVIHKNAKEGMYVQTGSRIYTIADLSGVWVLLDAYESDLVWLRYGQAVEFTAESYPGEVFKGTIAFIDPVLNQATRTVNVRVNVANPELKLKPGMFLRAVARANVASSGKVMDPDLAGKWICPMHPEVVHDSEGTCEVCGMPLVRTESLGYVGKKPTPADAPLVIPATAPLITGTRAIVYVSVPGKDRPTYEGREILLGPRAGDYYLVRRGLQEGDQVVTRGNFKLDAELQIRAKPSMMTPEGGGDGGEHAHHGAGQAGKSPPMGAPAVTIPATVRDALHDVVSAAEGAITIVSAGDLQKIRNAFANLGAKVAVVPLAQLSAHPAMLWKEHSMLLGNDGQEGHGAATLADAQRIAAQTREHLISLEANFGLSRGPEAPAAPVADEEGRGHE
ncbi:MAG: efflux RND transporter periplasmic adaptor subunit, partial [Verrucomicrobia bacterium]|nr:efflux RND transporter periplasmic adaptor subunit [Verrucomicrobiota bacterium]